MSCARSLHWRALGTYVFLGVSDGAALPEAAATARRLLAAVDATCSRFRTDSDLSHANRAPGSWVRVDPLLVAATRVAIEAAEVTGGLVSPCLGRCMLSLGYDRDFHTLTPGQVTPLRPPSYDVWRSVGVTDDAVRVPEGCALDLGATAKAWAADLVALAVSERTGSGCVVSLGGDVRVAGSTDAWPVRVSERPEDTEGELVRLGAGGLATSSTRVRRWWTDRGELHHLLDPRTGLPVDGSLTTATATGATCVAANTATTAALVLGDRARQWLSHHGVAARLVDRRGEVTRLGGWPAPATEAVA